MPLESTLHILFTLDNCMVEWCDLFILCEKQNGACHKLTDTNVLGLVTDFSNIKVVW